MDAVEFLKEYNRMRSRKSCGSCSLYREGGQCAPMESMNPLELAECVKKVEQWAKEHPIKTRQSEFLKMFPNSKRDEDGTLHACPEIFEPEIKKECDGDCHRCKFKRDYWLQEVE